MSFLDDYLQYATGNEAAEMFHVWSGYTALSAAVSRRVWLPYGDEAIFPNVYVMLVGDAGCGKSTALRKAKRLLSEMDNVPISRSVETPEGICRYMAGDPNGDPPVESPVKFVTTWPDGQLRDCHPMTIIANEFINFISKNQEGWIATLNDIYDEDRYEYRTKNKGEDLLIGPYVVMLGALTTDVSNELQKSKIIGTGLARRTIFQYGERNYAHPVAVPQFEEVQKSARARALAHCKSLQKLSGAFTVEDGFWSWWKIWYDEHTINVPVRSTPQTKGWFTSKPNQVLKIAMLTSLSEDTDLVLRIAHLECAIAYIAEMEKDLFQILGGSGRNELASVAVKIHEYVKTLPEPVLRRKLKATCWTWCRPPSDFDDCMTYLIQSELLASAMFQFGNVAEEIIAIPSVLKAFSDDIAAKQTRPLGATQTGSHQVVGVATGPSAAPSGYPQAVLPVPLTVVLPLGGIVTEQPPKAD